MPKRSEFLPAASRAITADSAIRLSRFFGTSAQVWLGLQTEYELDLILYSERIGKKNTFGFIKKFVPKKATL